MLKWLFRRTTFYMLREFVLPRRQRTVHVNHTYVQNQVVPPPTSPSPEGGVGQGRPRQRPMPKRGLIKQAFPDEAPAAAPDNVINQVPDVPAPTEDTFSLPFGWNVRHPFAVYRDEHNQVQKFPASDLLVPSRFLIARELDLFSPENGHRRLQARHGPGLPHFWCPADDGRQQHFVTARDYIDIKDQDPRHDQRVRDIVGAAHSLYPERIMTYQFSKEGYRPSQTPLDLANIEQFVLGDVRGYHWQPNVLLQKLDIGSGLIGRVRPDIIATPQPSVTPSEKNPLIYVEVVNTHYPSEETWQTYLHVSQKKPLIILFDFIESKNYLFEMQRKNAKKNIRQNQIRSVYYIWQGSVWENTHRLDNPRRDYTSRMFQDKMKQRLRKFTS